MYKKLSILLIVIIFMAACTNTTSSTVEQNQLVVSSFLEANDSFSEVIINSFELYHDTKKTKMYSMNYSIKPTNTDDFVLAGSMMEGENGWINIFHFVTFEKDGSITLTTSP